VTVTGIDWGGARVSDGTLTVELVPPPGRALAERLRRALALLDRGGGDWQSMQLRQATVTVDGVREGGEERLRALLDAALVEASGDLAAGAAEPGRELDEQRERDMRMTDTFRRFATSARR
jgi:hypothetical protein